MQIRLNAGLAVRVVHTMLALALCMSLAVACTPSNQAKPLQDSNATGRSHQARDEDTAQAIVTPTETNDEVDARKTEATDESAGGAPTGIEAKGDAAPNGADSDDPAIAVLAGRLEQSFDAYAQAQQFTGAALVARNGVALLSKGYGMADQSAGIPNGSRTRFRIGSLTKQFTAMVVLQLHEQGLLNITHPICDYLDNCPQSWSKITIEQLLTQRSGLPDFTHFPDYESTKYIASSPESTIDRFRNAPLEFEPGTAWNYSNSGYIVLGRIIENVTSKEYAAAVQEMVFDPLGMDDSGYDDGASNLAIGYRNASGAPADVVDMSIPFAAGALYSTADDMLKWDRAHAEGTLISAELSGAMFTSQADIPDSGGMGYGYGWIIADLFGRPVQTHNGGIEGFVANITRFPEDGTVIILLSNNEQTNPQQAMMVVAEALYAGE